MSSTSKMPWMVSCSSVHQVLDWQDAMTFFTLGMTLGCLGLCIRFDRAFCTTGSNRLDAHTHKGCPNMYKYLSNYN